MKRSVSFGGLKLPSWKDFTEYFLDDKQSTNQE